MAAIRQRVKGEMKIRQAETEWHAKTVSHFVIGAIGHENAKEHRGQLYKVLDQISLVNPKPLATPTADTSSSKPAFNYADIEERGNYDAALERNSRRKGGLGGFGALGVTPT